LRSFRQEQKDQPECSSYFIHVPKRAQEEHRSFTQRVRSFSQVQKDTPEFSSYPIHIFRSNYRSVSDQGFSIVELMIAMLVGLLLMGGAIDVLLSSRQTNSLQVTLSKIQQDGRLAINVLSTAIRMADYSGCYTDLSDGLENTLKNQASFAWDLSDTIEGFDNVSASFTISDAASGGAISSILEGTDVLVIKGMADGVPIRSNPDSSTFTIDATLNNLNTGEILIVADCEQASMFQASSIISASDVTTILHAADGMTPDNNTATVTKSYETDAEIAKLVSTVYYLKNDTSGIPGLFQSSLSVNSSGDTVSLVENQLVSNVENMQIQYGVDNDDDQDVDTYDNAAAVTDWKTVISVRIALLLASENDFLIDTDESYSFNNTSFTFTKDSTPTADADRKLRRTFTGLMAFRNRTL
ncbi:MAG: PilW family protein, partial [Methylococcales bacterium]